MPSEIYKLLSWGWPELAKTWKSTVLFFRKMVVNRCANHMLSIANCMPQHYIHTVYCYKTFHYKWYTKYKYIVYNYAAFQSNPTGYRCTIRAPIFPPTNTSVAAVRTSGFRFSVFRFPVSPPFPWYTHKAPHIPFSSSSYSGKVVASVQDKSGEISYFCVLSCTKMVAHLTQVFIEYKERALVLWTGCFSTVAGATC